MRRITLACLLAFLLTVTPATAQTADTMAAHHQDHGHQQWRQGHGTPGHTWRAYQHQAAQLRAYYRAIAANRMRACGAEPHCAVRLASFLTRSPYGLNVRVVDCESGFNPAAANPSSSAGGLYQFLASTWESMAPGWGMAGRSRFETWPAAYVGAGTIAQGGIGHWAASQGCWG